MMLSAPRAARPSYDFKKAIARADFDNTVAQLMENDSIYAPDLHFD